MVFTKFRLYLAFFAVAIVMACSPKIVPKESKALKTISNISIGEGLVVEMPGLWTSSSVNKLTNQYFVRSQDSSLVSVSVNPITKYPFFTDGMADSSFVNELFLWESGHFAEQGFVVNVLDKNHQKGYILWDIKKDTKTIKMLYGKKNMDAVAINFLESRSYTPNGQAEFLKEVFSNYASKAKQQK